MSRFLAVARGEDGRWEGGSGSQPATVERRCGEGRHRGRLDDTQRTARRAGGRARGAGRPVGDPDLLEESGWTVFHLPSTPGTVTDWVMVSVDRWMGLAAARLLEPTHPLGLD